MNSKEHFKTIPTFHQDMIHDIAFDWYGQKIATCSTDRSVKIWQKKEQGDWEQITSVTNQEGPIRKVIWAHPEFGNILAACSMDRSIGIYEENKDFRSLPKEIGEQQPPSQWRVSRIYDDKEPIEDMKFGPKHLGLVLAVARSNGRIRIFQFTDLLNLQIHSNLCDIQVSTLGINCISWNKNRFERTMLAVGLKDAQTSQTKNLQGINSQQKGTESCFKILVFQKLNSMSTSEQQVMKLVAAEPNVSIVHSQAVNDVSWSLINGRSFHLIGTCGREGARVWYVKYTNDSDDQMTVLRVVDLFNLESSSALEVWKISWNVMASLVATSDNNNDIKIFKSSGIGKWEMIKTIKETQDQELSSH